MSPSRVPGDVSKGVSGRAVNIEIFSDPFSPQISIGFFFFCFFLLSPFFYFTFFFFLNFKCQERDFCSRSTCPKISGISFLGFFFSIRKSWPLEEREEEQKEITSLATLWDKGNYITGNPCFPRSPPPPHPPPNNFLSFCNTHLAVYGSSFLSPPPLPLPSPLLLLGIQLAKPEGRRRI